MEGEWKIAKKGKTPSIQKIKICCYIDRKLLVNLSTELIFLVNKKISKHSRNRMVLACPCRILMHLQA